MYTLAVIICRHDVEPRAAAARRHCQHAAQPHPWCATHGPWMPSGKASGKATVPSGGACWCLDVRLMMEVLISVSSQVGVSNS